MVEKGTGAVFFDFTLVHWNSVDVFHPLLQWMSSLHCQKHDKGWIASWLWLPLSHFSRTLFAWPSYCIWFINLSLILAVTSTSNLFQVASYKVSMLQYISFHFIWEHQCSESKTCTTDKKWEVTSHIVSQIPLFVASVLDHRTKASTISSKLSSQRKERKPPVFYHGKNRIDRVGSCWP